MEQINIEDHRDLLEKIKNLNYVNPKVLISRNNMHELNISSFDGELEYEDTSNIEFIVLAGMSDRQIVIGDASEFVHESVI